MKSINKTLKNVDSIIINGKIVNVLTKEIYKSQIAIKNGIIYAVDDNLTDIINDSAVIIDAKNSFIVPGFIDQHIHLHHTQLNIVEFNKICLQRGTTAIATDLYGEGVVGGIKAIRDIIDIAHKCPIRMFYLLPMCGYIQNGKFGHNGNLNIDDMYEILSWNECVGTSDTFATEILDGNEDFIKLCKKAQKLGKKVSGHGSELNNIQINDWVRVIKETDDHECIDENEMLYKLRHGVGISMRLASGSEDLPNLIKLLKIHKDIEKRKIVLNSDVISATDLYEKGYLDRAIKIMIDAGIPVLDAYQMATINTAENLNISHFYGSITPGRSADLLFIDDLEDVSISDVIFNGRIVMHDRVLTETFPEKPFPDSFFNTVKINQRFNKESLKIFYNKNKKPKVRVILVDGQSYITNEMMDVLPVKNGFVECDIDRDIIYVSALDRVKGSDKISNAFVKGFSLKKGAFGLTKNSHQQSLLVAGTNHDDMYIAVKALERIGGGNIVVCDGEIIGSLPLQLFGLESADKIETVVKQRKDVLSAIEKLGCTLPSPFETLSFIALPVTIGNLKICQEGLVDVWKNELVDVIIE